MPTALPGLVFGAAFWCFTLGLISLWINIPEFLSATLIITGLFLVFAYYHLDKHQHKSSQ